MKLTTLALRKPWQGCWEMFLGDACGPSAEVEGIPGRDMPCLPWADLGAWQPDEGQEVLQDPAVLSLPWCLQACSSKPRTGTSLVFLGGHGPDDGEQGDLLQA